MAEQKERSFSPDKPPAEKALYIVNRFASVDINKIHTLDHLNVALTDVGPSLQSLIWVYGTYGVLEGEAPGYGSRGKLPKMQYILKRSVGEGDITAYESTRDMLRLYHFKGQGNYKSMSYILEMPTHDDILPGTGFTNDRPYALARDMRGEKTLHHNPGREPNDPQVQQGFARVLQDTLKDIMEGVKPVKLPERWEWE